MSTVVGRGKLQSCRRRGKYMSVEEEPEMGNECDYLVSDSGVERERGRRGCEGEIKSRKYSKGKKQRYSNEYVAVMSRARKRRRGT